MPHQVHLRLFQFHLLLLQLLAVKKFHAKVLKQRFGGHWNKYTQTHKSIHASVLYKSLTRTITQSLRWNVLQKNTLYQNIQMIIWPMGFFFAFFKVYSFYLIYLLVNLLVRGMESQGPQKQMSGTFRWTSVLQLTLSCHNPEGLKRQRQQVFNGWHFSLLWFSWGVGGGVGVELRFVSHSSNRICTF